MQYVGIYSQIRRNNIYSMLLLLAFPCIILLMIFVFLAASSFFMDGYYDDNYEYVAQIDFPAVISRFTTCLPWVLGGVTLWFIIAYFFHSSIIRSATGAVPMERRENKRVYNIVENLCMSCGMNMPKLYVVNDPQLNAFASGIDEKSYAVTLTTGIIDILNDEELAGVVAHELTHIRNRDTRLLITSIIFVGIISTSLSFVWRVFYHSVRYDSDNISSFFGSNNSNKKRGSSALHFVIILLIGIVCILIAWLFMSVTRFAISRKREYMADAGGAELTRNPQALASALRKISDNPGLQDCKRDDIAQLFIVHQSALSGASFLKMFSTHPDINNRIEILEQF